MSTDYHYITPIPETKYGIDSTLIGTSTGTSFIVNLYPRQGINSIEDWQKLWNNPQSEILSEYNVSMTPDEMEELLKKGKIVYSIL